MKITKIWVSSLSPKFVERNKNRHWRNKVVIKCSLTPGSISEVLQTTVICPHPLRPDISSITNLFFYISCKVKTKNDLTNWQPCLWILNAGKISRKGKSPQIWVILADCDGCWQIVRRYRELLPRGYPVIRGSHLSCCLLTALME